MPETLLAGGRYRLLRTIAQGGMGEVLLADFPGDSGLNISSGYVVLKRVLADAQNRPHQTRMLREEARLSLRLLHANLVESFFLDEHEGDPILVMEFLAGRSLAHLLGLAKKRREMVPVDVILAIVRAAACGLYFAHTLTDRGRPLGLIHRDVSPANLFVTFDGRVKVIDFGVAKSADSEISTSTGVLKGKIGYMSPEHADGELALTPSADLWSLGVVMWECLCAERLFAGGAPAETLRAIAAKPIPPPTLLRKDISPAVVAVCMALLERDVTRRIATGEQLVRAIDALPEADAVARVDLGAFLKSRFPDEVDAGLIETARSARMERSTPVPVGLVAGTATAAPDDQEMPTLVVRAEDALAAAQQAGVPQSRPLEASDDVPTKRVLARGALLVEPDSSPSDEGHPVPAPGGPRTSASDDLFDVDEAAAPAAKTATHTVPVKIADLAPLGVPLPAPPRSNASRATGTGTGSRPVLTQTQTRTSTVSLQTTSLAGTAMLSFGVLALLMGIGLSFVARPAPVTAVFVYEDPHPVLVGRVEDVPEGRASTPVSLESPVLPGLGALAADDAATLRARLDKEGVLARAALPPPGRARVGALLPLLLAGLGLLAIAFALPALLLAGRPRLIGRVALLCLTSLGLFLAVRSGALGWPGLTAWDDVRRVELKAP